MKKMTVGDSPKQGRGKTQRMICPNCGKYYLVAAYIHQGITDKSGKPKIHQKWKKIGTVCQGCEHFESITLPQSHNFVPMPTTTSNPMIHRPDALLFEAR